MNKHNHDEVYDQYPFADTSKWEPEKWYPLPIGFMERNQKEYIIEGYEIFKLDPKAPMAGDIIPVGLGTHTFSVALKMCETYNEQIMLI